MSALRREFATFLRRRAWLWMGLIVAFYVLLAAVAWLQTERPETPFIYQVF